MIASEEDARVIEAMERWGGSFVQALAACLRRADASNFATLKAAFPAYWLEYQSAAKNLEP